MPVQNGACISRGEAVHWVDGCLVPARGPQLFIGMSCSTCYPQRRRALLLTGDAAARHDYASALAAYGYDVACEPTDAPPAVAIVIVDEYDAHWERTLERVEDVPSVVVAPAVRIDDAAALLRASAVVLSAPADPIEVVRAARKLTRQIVAPG